jgi:hypothetical protein
MGEIDHYLDAFIQEWMKCDHINQINFPNENFNKNIILKYFENK